VGMEFMKEPTSIFNKIRNTIELEGGKLYNVNFDASDLPSGIYYAQLIQAKNSKVIKLVLMK
jgi:hypothetical protein